MSRYDRWAVVLFVTGALAMLGCAVVPMGAWHGPRVMVSFERSVVR